MTDRQLLDICFLRVFAYQVKLLAQITDSISVHIHHTECSAYVEPGDVDAPSDEIAAVLQAAQAEESRYKKLMKTSATNLV